MIKLVRVFFYLIVVLFIGDVTDLFQTKLSIFKSFIYYSILLLPIPLLIMELKAHCSEPILRKAIPILTIVGLVYLNPLKLFFNIQPWQTQQVILINENYENHKVELQSKDVGALGYAKRKAEVFYLSSYFYIVLSKSYDDRNFMGINWKRIDSKK
ncbi:hypothetical protein HNV08_00885 [Winogradskyella eckloniae]|uniref:hypothetical protein n=1 Tax=Winogradskyella eckloniae TaxID=1089306 RepID=UPI00156417DF|nr:hypothetical protein [Winogradskyella eckloniae]NRD18585.1 hypothetical protein [Winogradskyella eckloniae]